MADTIFDHLPDTPQPVPQASTIFDHLPDAPKPFSLGQEATHVLGRFEKGAEAAYYLPNRVVNMVAQKLGYEPPLSTPDIAGTINRGANLVAGAAGAPEMLSESPTIPPAQTTAGRYAGAIGEMAGANAIPALGLASRLEQAGVPLASQVAGYLTSSAGAGTASEAARSAGASPMVQNLAAIAGGVAAPVGVAGVAGALESGARVPVISKSAQLLNEAGVKLSAGQQRGGTANQIGEMASAMPFSGMAAPRSQGIPTFNRAAENMALEPAAIPELASYVHSRVPETWEKAAQKAPEGAPAVTPPQTPVAPGTDLDLPGSGLGPLGRLREPATHTLEVRLRDGTGMLMEGTPAELEAAKGRIQQVAGPGASALSISPKSNWIGASMPVRRAPPLPPADGAAQAASGLPSASGNTGVGPAADLPPGSQFRGNAVGDDLPATGSGTPPPGYSYQNNFPGWKFRGNLQGEKPDYVAERSGETPEASAAAAKEDAAPRTGDITPGFEGRKFVRQQANQAYDITYNGAPGEATPRLGANLEALRRKLGNVDLPGAKEETVQQYRDVLDKYIFNRFEPARTGAPDSTTGYATIEGPQLFDAIKEINKIGAAARLRGGDGFDLSSALTKVKGELLTSLKAQDPTTAARLKAADEIWSHYAELRRAGVSAKDDLNGQFTPPQLSQASASADRSSNKVRTSEGETRYGPLARAGIDVNLRKPPEPSVEAKLGLLGGVAAAGVAGHGWPLAAYPAMWAYSKLGGEALARGYLNTVAPEINHSVNAALAQGVPIATNAAGVLAHQPNYLTAPSGRLPPPQAGETRKGHRFKGGDPSRPENWEAIR